MKSMERYQRYAVCGMIGLLLVCAGILVGQVLWPKEAEDAAPAFAAATGDAAWPDTAADPTLPEVENWFAVDVVTPVAEPERTPALETPVPVLTAVPTPEAVDAPNFQIELVRDGAQELARQEGDVKRVLIYHTHTYEAYAQSESDRYQETEQWRTADAQHNMVAVGEELAMILRDMGVEVVHDTTAFEPPDLNASYTRSLEMLEQRQSLGETYDLYIDLHRDAYVASQEAVNALAVGDGSVAKLMLLVGKGEGQTTEGLGEKPAWELNLSIAQQITDALNSGLEGICKEVHIRSGRYNQHIDAGGCLLVEVGNNQNTLAEAKAAMPYLAGAIYAALEPGE